MDTQTCKSLGTRMCESNNLKEMHFLLKKKKRRIADCTLRMCKLIIYILDHPPPTPPHPPKKKTIYLIKQALRGKTTNLIHINGLNCFPTGKYYSMVLIFWFAFSKFWISRKLN